MKNIAVFASGTGSNFLAIHQAILNNEINTKITLLVSDRSKSKALENAKKMGINCFAFRAKAFESKEAYELQILKELRKNNVELIVLAGYMRIIGKTILEKYPKRIINIHPSLLPSFKGIDAVGQAMEAQVSVTGVTVHYVDEGMDTGEIIAQEELDISNLHKREEIEIEIHKIEHKLYPATIKRVLEDLS
ncbi:Phosphoribosylglycinamide formyltransferase [Candidatus Izimaplasma bacterium HR1]|jgi:phosphoribosylglycinamide formyltransferase-1|uniref:phosphoribosylglycinamide formyltransferase n=1 Tax=Candidatus Izimoplasma sp. HR1 TaxID=1541959 RepID=UPI0004F6EC81|nr:Phosphoribosylglycinamide formyltransferase [Candidatus Izimaplasma bacterium HR1]